MTDTPVQFVSTLSPTTFTPSVNVTLRSASTLSVSALARHRPVVGTRSLPSMGSVDLCWTCLLGRCVFIGAGRLVRLVHSLVLIVTAAEISSTELLTSLHNITIPAHRLDDEDDAPE